MTVPVCRCRTQSFQQNRHYIFLAHVPLKLLVSLISHLRQTDTQNDYRNPCCACSPRVNNENGKQRDNYASHCQLVLLSIILGDKHVAQPTNGQHTSCQDARTRAAQFQTCLAYINYVKHHSGLKRCEHFWFYGSNGEEFTVYIGRLEWTRNA